MNKIEGPFLGCQLRFAYTGSQHCPNSFGSPGRRDWRYCRIFISIVFKTTTGFGIFTNFIRNVRVNVG